ncbi:hypothetical protein BDW66DRAFT_126334, partial [Aspergillus desertorum]
MGSPLSASSTRCFSASLVSRSLFQVKKTMACSCALLPGMSSTSINRVCIHVLVWSQQYTTQASVRLNCQPKGRSSPSCPDEMPAVQQRHGELSSVRPARQYHHGNSPSSYFASPMGLSTYIWLCQERRNGQVSLLLDPV